MQAPKERLPYQEPPFLFIELTNHCNMHCTFCPSDELSKPRMHASDDHVRSMLQQAHDLGLRSPVQFNVLGEPLLNPRVYNYISLCEELGFRVILITNISLLQDKRLDRILEHPNVALVLSLQTPTPDSYKIRNYEKIREFENYIGLVTNAIRRKFALQSQSRIEIHVASELDDHSLQRDAGSFRLWQIFRDDAEQLDFLHSYVHQLQDLKKELAATWPAFFEKELKRARADFAHAYADGTVDEHPDRLLANPNELTDKDFWGWMCAPNVFLRVKRFGLWAKQRPFLYKHLQPDEVVFIEERTEPFDCEMAYNISMLADGSFSLCCLDYEGEMGMGNIKSNSLQSVLASAQRRQTVANAMVHRICRECQGNAFVFKRSPVSEPQQLIEHCGFGWHHYEPTLGGVGGRWTSRTAHTYVYPRLKAHSLEIEFLSPHDSAELLSVDICEQTADGLFAFLNSVPFHGKQGEISRVEIPVSLEPFRLYRATISSPTFVPARGIRGYALAKQLMRSYAENIWRFAGSFWSKKKSFVWRPFQVRGDTRSLGIAVLSLRLKGEIVERLVSQNLVQIDEHRTALDRAGMQQQRPHEQQS